MAKQMPGFAQTVGTFLLVANLQLSSAIASSSLEILEQGRSAESAGEYRKAAAYFRKAMNFPEARVGALIGLSRSLVGLGEVADAREALQAYLQSEDAFSVEVRITLVDILNLSQDYQAALRELDRIDSLRPKLPAARERRGETLLALKRYEECVAILNVHLKDNPGATASRLRRAKALIALGKMPAAVTDLKRVVEDRPGDPAIHLLYAEALEGTSHFAGAEQALLLAVRLDPNSPETQSRVGTFYLSRGRATESIAYLKRSVELDPSQIQAYLLIARAHLALKQPKLAEQTLLQALRIAPNHEESLLELSQLYFAQGTLDKAGSLLQEFVRTHPERSQPVLQFVQIALGIGRSDLADEVLKAHHATGALSAESSVLQAFVKAQLVGPAEAIQVLEAAGKRFPKDPFVHFNLGLAYQQSGRDTEAIQAYKSVREGSKAYSKARVNQALLLEKRGQVSEAARALSEALKSDPSQTLVEAKLLELRAKSVAGRAGEGGRAPAGRPEVEGRP